MSGAVYANVMPFLHDGAVAEAPGRQPNTLCDALLAVELDVTSS